MINDKRPNFKTITERGEDGVINEKRKIKKLLEKHYTGKENKDNKNKVFRTIKEHPELLIISINYIKVN